MTGQFDLLTPSLGRCILRVQAPVRKVNRTLCPHNSQLGIVPQSSGRPPETSSSSCNSLYGLSILSRLMYCERVMAVFPRARDQLGVLFGLFVLSQALVLVFALLLFSGLPTPQIVPQFAESLNAPALNAQSITAVVSHQDVEQPTESEITYRVQRGDTLSTIWEKIGAPRSGAIMAAKAFKEAGLSAASLKVEDELQMSLSLDGDVTSLQQALSDGRWLIIHGNSQDGYESSMLDADIEETQASVSGTIFSSFADAALAQGIPYSVIDEYVDLFSSRVEFQRDLQPGATFAVTYLQRHCRRSGTALSPGKIVAASLWHENTLLAAVRYVGRNGRAYYFDEQGQPLGNYFLRYPLRFSRISSSFNWARFHPVYQRSRPHLGVDFAAPYGTPVRAVADGVVVEAGYNRDGGNTVKIKHGSRYSTAYLHLAKIGSGIKRGATVARGQLIGTVGSTGISTGPHLHFSLFDYGRYIDPLKAKLPALPEGVESIPKAVLVAAIDTLKQHHAQVAVAMEDSSRMRKS